MALTERMGVTALLHNLLHPGQLPLLEAVAAGRMGAAILRPQPDDDMPRFDYERAIGRLTGTQGFSGSSEAAAGTVPS